MIEQVEWFIKQLGASRLLREIHFRGDRDHPWSVLARTCGSKRHLMVVAWAPPPVNVIKLNTDASVSSSGAFGGGNL